MNYMFDVDIATEHGVDEAIVINNFQFWIFKNKADERNKHDGRTWTFNSVKSFESIFPFWSSKQIRRVVDSLVKKGILITGNFNIKGYDRTTWYAFENEDKWLHPLNSAILPNGQMHFTKRANAFAQTGEPIPDNKTQIVNTDKDKYLSSVADVFNYWTSVMQKTDMTKLTPKRKTNITNRLKDKYTVQQIKSAIDGCSKSGWHMGDNEQGTLFNDIELICRSGDKLEGFFNINEKSQNTPGQGSSSGSLNTTRTQYAANNSNYQESRTNHNKRVGADISSRHATAVAEALADGTF